jgi:hypothetical protein
MANEEAVVICGRCRNCANWSGDEQDGFRICTQPLAYIGYWKAAKDAEPNGLLIEGDEGWGWYTGPEFGCVNFTAANKQPRGPL